MDLITNKYQKQLLRKIQYFHKIDPWNDYQKIIQVEIIFNFMYNNFDQIHGYYYLIHSKQHRAFYILCKEKANSLSIFLEEQNHFCCDKFEQRNCERAMQALEKYMSKSLYPIEILLCLHRKIDHQDLVTCIMEFL